MQLIIKQQTGKNMTRDLHST